MTNPDLDRDLGAWLKERAPARAPANLLGATLYRTARTRPRAAWRIPDRWLPKRVVSPVARRWGAAAIVIVLLIIMLLAVALLPFVGGPQVPPTPRLGVEIPQGATEGTIETPLGPARWVHLVGDQDTLPPAPRVDPASPSADFTALDQRRSEEGAPLAAFRWTSPDGMRWEREPLEAALAGPIITHDGGGATWRMTWQPSRLARSTDGKRWDEVDLSSAIPDDASPAIVWEVEPNGIASTDAATVVHVSYRALEPFETLRWRPGSVIEVEPGLIAIRGRGEEDFSAARRLRLTPTEDGIRLTDDADGALVIDLPGTTVEDVRGWIASGPPVRHRLAIVEGDRLVPVMDLKDLGDPLSTALATMRGGPDGIEAFILDAPHGPARLWRTVDGRAWTDHGPWSLPTGEPGGAFYMGSSFGPFHAEYHPPNVSTVERVWRSEDGLEWRQVMASIPADSNIIELKSGTIAQQWIEGGERWWAASDGATWEPLDLSSLGIEIGQRQFDYGEVGDTAFIVVDDESGRRDMWILSFDTVPDRPTSPRATVPA